MTSPPEVILPPTRSAGTAASALIAAAIVVVLGVALVLDPAVEIAAKVAVGALGALFAGTLAGVGVTLLRGHGALLLDVAGGRLGLGVTRADDTWWLPLDQVNGLAVMPVAGRGDAAMIERWLLVVGLVGRPDVVLAESDDRGAILGIRERLAARLALHELAEDRPADGDFAAHATRYAVSRGAALQALLAFFGLSSIAVGVIAFTEVQKEPVVGFMFAPVLVVMGLALLAVPLVKRLATETLTFDGRRWTHAWTFARFRWAERTIVAPAPRFRMRLLGMRGGMLELTGEDGSLVLAAGATARSHLDLEGVAAIPSRFLPR